MCFEGIEKLQYFSSIFFQSLHQQHLAGFIVNVLQEHRFHFADAPLPLGLAVRFVQVDTDATNVLAVPIQPKDSMTETPNIPRQLSKLSRILVVDLLHSLLHVFEVGRHVFLHTNHQPPVDVVDGSNVPAVLSGLDFHEAIVVTGLHEGVVHRKLVVEEDVVDLLRDSVLSQTDEFLHPFGVVGFAAEPLQNLLSEYDMVVDDDVVDDVCCLIVHRRGVPFGSDIN